MSKPIRIAVNPLSYWINESPNYNPLGAFKGHASKPKGSLDQAFADLSEIGFKAVKADIPEGMTPAEYASWLDGYGLQPAVSLYNSSFVDTVPMDEDIERAKRFAAQQAELGLNVTMLCSAFIPERFAVPAVGHDFREDRLQHVIENAGRIAEAILAEGVKPMLHPHVGGWIEVEHEIVAVLDALGPDLLGFGPDTGHLTWAGVDAAAIIARYADRVGAMHVKNVYGEFLDKEAAAGMTYWQIASTKRHWAEPGRGVVDFDRIIAAIPDDFEGDFMIEVDIPSIDRLESFRESYAWATTALGFASLAR